MGAKLRIVVAMSGGVDSSTVAGLLKEAGHQVIGVALKTHNTASLGSKACCTPHDMVDARQVAATLQIPFYVLNYADLFGQEVVAPFAAAYRQGTTPNPCVACNEKVKFGPLLARAKLLDADFLATGHYARIWRAQKTLWLQRGRDRQKDQSYFMYRMQQAQLRSLMFPLGEMCKQEVRAHAARLGLPVADKPESQEICFVGKQGYAKTVEQIAPTPHDVKRTGHILDLQGRPLGTHAGIHHFTVGQRRGLGLAAAAPLYVVHIDALQQNIYVGPKAALEADTLAVGEVMWGCDSPADHSEVVVQQRHRDVGCVARLQLLPQQQARLHLAGRMWHGAPGQAAVLYAHPHGGAHREPESHIVLGGGVLLPRRRLPIVQSPAEAAHA